MKQGSEFDSPLQTAHMCFLKGVLGVKRSTPNWAVLRELLNMCLVEVCLVLAPDVNFFLNSRKKGLPCWRSYSFFLYRSFHGWLSQN